MLPSRPLVAGRSPRVVRSSATRPGARDRSARAALSRRRGTGAARGFRGGGSPGARATAGSRRDRREGEERAALRDVTRRTTMRPPERRCCEASAGTGGAAPRVERAAAPPRVDASRRSIARATRAGESARDAEWAPRPRGAPYARTVCCSTAEVISVISRAPVWLALSEAIVRRSIRAS